MLSSRPWVHAIVFILLLNPVVGAVTNSTNSTFDALSYVDPLIGSTDGGNVFTGATLPYGMAKAVADVDGQNTGGFSTDGSNVTGFSHMHDSGTGGNPSLGNFPLMPQLCPGDDINNCVYPKDKRKVPYDNSSIVARPGYFALKLQNGIGAEMVVSEHAALYRFNFPSASGGNASSLHPQLVLDLTDLWDSRQNATISIDARTGRMTGNGTFLPSFGAGTYHLHFCVDFAGASVYDSGIWVNDRAGTEPKELFVTRGFNLFYIEAGGFVRFEWPSNGTVTARVGMSFISADQACHNAETEIAGFDVDFDNLRSAAEAAWKKQLAPISVETGGATEDLQKSFWSASYRTMISPQNYTGENSLWSSSVPYFDSFYW